MLRLKQIWVDCLGVVLGVLDGTLDSADFGVEDTAGGDEEGEVGAERVGAEGVGATTGGEVDWCRLPFCWDSGSGADRIALDFCKGVGMRKSDSQMG